MTFRGTVRNGKVEFEDSGALPNGTPVDVYPTRKQPRSVYRLYELAAEGGDGHPRDYAAEVDHYLYGSPKRNGRKTARTGGSRRSSSPKQAASRQKKPTKKRSR